MLEQIIQNSIASVFAVLQGLILVVISCAFKMYWDVRRIKKDQKAAFIKIRNLESWKKEYELRDILSHRTLEPSKDCHREGAR